MTNTELIKIREGKKLTKSEFAKLLGITPMLEGRYESGKLVIPEAVAEKTTTLTTSASVMEEKKTTGKKSLKKKDTVYTPEEVKAAVKAEMSRLVDEFNKTSAEKYEVESIEVEVEGDSEPVAKEDVIEAVGKAFEEQMVPKKGKKATDKKAAAEKAPAKKSAPKKTAKQGPRILIQSLLGGTITPEEVVKRVPKGVDTVYIKPEENKAYWGQGEEDRERGSVVIIRNSLPADLPAIMETYAYARSFMASHGNPRQWGATNWPPEELIREDIASGKGYVCVEGEDVVGVFFYDYGENIEPMYDHIEDGDWEDGSPYGVIHRIAGNGKAKGIGHTVMEWAKERCSHLRIDTHPDNTVMQNMLKREGFVFRGITHVLEDDDPRLAYERTT